MSGPAKLNENTKIVRRLPTLSDDFYFAAPGTGIGGVSQINNLVGLFSGIAPTVSYANIAAMLAGATPLRYFTYVADATDDPAIAEAIWAIYLYIGPDSTNLNSYLLMQKDGGVGGTLEDVLTAGNDGGGIAIENIDDPSNPQDAATKNYVDVAIAALGGGVVIHITYATIAAMLADQANQDTGKWYMATDATGDPSVDAGFAIYLKTATTTASISDYIKVIEQESLDIVVAAWTDTAAGLVERSTAGGSSESENIATQAAAGGSSGLSSSRAPSEVGLKDMLIKLFNTAVTWVAKMTFTAAPRFNSVTASNFLTVDSNKDLTSVAAATQSESVTGTDDTKPMTPLSLESKASVKRAACSVSAGTMTLNCDNKESIRFENTTTISSNFTLAFSNDANAELIEANVFITGTVVATMPSSVVMSTIDGRWANGSKQLTLTGVTASPFCMIFSKISSSRYELISSYAQNPS